MGSEMCIRDRGGSEPEAWARVWEVLAVLHPPSPSSNCGDIYVREAGETLELRKSLEQGLEAKVKYSVEVQAPGHFEDPPALKLESDKPPMPINVGDLINLRNYSRALESADCTLVEVCKVEHIFGDSQERDDRWTRHRIVVFTKTASDAGATRVPGYPD